MSASADAELQELASMVVRIIGDGSSYTKMLKDVKSSTADVGKTLDKGKSHAEIFGKTIDDLGTKMSGMAGQFRAMAALGSPFEMIKKGVGLASEAESMQVAFGTMLKDVEKGKEMVKDLQDFAAATPLNTTGIQSTTKTLLQFDIAGRNIIPTLRMLGDVTNGEQDKMQRMALAFGQAKSAGRLMGEEVAQMREAGFNPLQEIARTTHKTMAELTSTMEKGGITIEMMEKAFKTATSAGGAFENGMEKASKTLKGLMSTMADDIDGFLRTVGTHIIGEFNLKGMVGDVSNVAKTLTTQFEILSPNIKSLVTVVVLLVSSVGTLIVVWKVTALAGGMIIGVLKDVVISTAWAAKGVYAYAGSLMSLRITTTVVDSTGMLATSITKVNVAAVAARYAIAGLVTYGLAELVISLSGAGKSYSELEEAMKKSTELSTKSAEARTKTSTRLMATAMDKDLSEIERIKFMKSELERTEKDITSITAKINAPYVTVEERSGRPIMKGFLSVASFGAISPETSEDKLERDRIEALKPLLADTKKYAGELKDKLDELAKPKGEKEFKDLWSALNKEFETLSLTAEETKIYELQLLGVKEAKLDETRAIMASIKVRKDEIERIKNEIEEYDKLSNEVGDFIHQMKLASETFGMSTEEAKLYELGLKGVSNQVLDMAMGHIRAREVLEKHKAIMDEGKEITKQYLTPLQNYTEHIRTLNNLLSNGAIEKGTFTRAMDDAKKKLIEASDGMKEVTASALDMDAAIYGSAESFSRMAKYQDLINKPSSSLKDPKVLDEKVKLIIQRGDVAIVGAINQGNIILNKIAEKKTPALNIADFDTNIHTIGIPGI